MVTLKTAKDIEYLRKGGKILARVLRTVLRKVKPGVSAFELDLLARDLMKRWGGRPSFLGYRPMRHSEPFPGALCVSANDVIVHGLPGKNLLMVLSKIMLF